MSRNSQKSPAQLRYESCVAKLKSEGKNILEFSSGFLQKSEYSQDPTGKDESIVKRIDGPLSYIQLANMICQVGEKFLRHSILRQLVHYEIEKVEFCGKNVETVYWIAVDVTDEVAKEIKAKSEEKEPFRIDVRDRSFYDEMREIEEKKILPEALVRFLISAIHNYFHNCNQATVSDEILREAKEFLSGGIRFIGVDGNEYLWEVMIYVPDDKERDRKVMAFAPKYPRGKMFRLEELE